MFFIVDKILRPKDGDDAHAWVIWSLLEDENSSDSSKEVSNNKDAVARIVASTVEYLEWSITKSSIKFITTGSRRIAVQTTDDFVIGLGCSKFFTNQQVDDKLSSILDIICFYCGSFGRIRTALLGPGPAYKVDFQFRRLFYPPDNPPVDESGKEVPENEDREAFKTASIGLFFKRFIEDKFKIIPATTLNLKFISQHGEKDIIFLAHQLLSNLINRKHVCGVTVFSQGKIILSSLPHQLTNNVQYLIEQNLAMTRKDQEDNLNLPWLSDESKEYSEEELSCRNLREVYLTKSQFIQCLNSSQPFTQNEHLSTNFNPRSYQNIRGGLPLGSDRSGGLHKRFSNAGDNQKFPKMKYERVPLFLYDLGNTDDIATCILLEKAPLNELDKTLKLIKELSSRAKSYFDILFQSKQSQTNNQYQEQAANVLTTVLEKRPEKEVLQMLQLAPDSGSSGKNNANNFKTDTLFGVNTTTGALTGVDDFKQTEEDSMKTFALAYGILDQSTHHYPGHPTEMHLKSSQSYQAVSKMGPQVVFYEHKFTGNSGPDTQLSGVISRMEKQALELSKYRTDKQNSQ